MKQVPGAGFTIFLLFFGVSVLQAFTSENWLLIPFWVIIGSIFFYLDRQQSRN